MLVPTDEKAHTTVLLTGEGFSALALRICQAPFAYVGSQEGDQGFLVFPVTTSNHYFNQRRRD